MIRMKDGMMLGALSDPDAACEHILNMLKTKGAILEYVEPIAQVIAEAGRASAKAMGDSAEHGAREWSRVILERALEILREERKERMTKKFEQIGADVICPTCRGERRGKDGRLCDRCNGTAQIRRSQLRPGEEPPFERTQP